MKIEEIKKEVAKWAFENTKLSVSETQRVIGATHVLYTYYTPLEESHRELVEVLQKYVDCDDLYNEEDCRAARTALSNAKKLINERP